MYLTIDSTGQGPPDELEHSPIETATTDVVRYPTHLGPCVRDRAGQRCAAQEGDVVLTVSHRCIRGVREPELAERPPRTGRLGHPLGHDHQPIHVRNEGDREARDRPPKLTPFGTRGRYHYLAELAMEPPVAREPAASPLRPTTAHHGAEAPQRGFDHRPVLGHDPIEVPEGAGESDQLGVGPARDEEGSQPHRPSGAQRQVRGATGTLPGAEERPVHVGREPGQARAIRIERGTSGSTVGPPGSSRRHGGIDRSPLGSYGFLRMRECPRRTPGAVGGRRLGSSCAARGRAG